MTRDRDRYPELPDRTDRMPAQFVDGPHPTMLPVEALLRDCDLRTQRRSGPGGQHRNKTSSGVFLLHPPTGVIGEATERRSQADNREVALSRLRMRLAVEIRTASILDGQVGPDELELRQLYEGGDLRIGDRNDRKPAALALLLNDLHAAGGQPSAVAQAWRTSTSAIIRLLKSHRPAFLWVNEVRRHHGRQPLK